MKELLIDPQKWSAVAASYDQTARHKLTPFSEEAVRWAELDVDDDVLDVAAGPGTLTVLAAQRARSVRALDFAPGMVAKLKENTADMENVSSLVANGQDLPFDDGVFSAAFSMFGLMFFPDPVAGLREIHRVLRPGGRVVISSWVPMGESPMMRPLGSAMRLARPPQPDQPPPEPFAFDSLESLEEGLRGGGFSEVQVRRFSPSLPIVDADSYWRESRGNLFIQHIRETTGPDWDGIESRIVEYLRVALQGVRALEMPALLGIARKSGV